MMMRSPRARRLSLLALALALWLSPGPPTFAEATPDDPVVADVVRMLDAGVEPRLILGWLESGNRRPASLSAGDMIALAAAEAPAELIEDLLARAARPAEIEHTPPARQPTAEVRQDDPPRHTSGHVGAGDCCLIDFSVEYRAPEQDAAGQTDSPRADLYLYLDGRFLGRFAPRSEIGSKGPQLNKYRIAPGQHTIRLTRELHLPSKNKKAGGARDHLTTVSPSSIDFELLPGAQWTMDIRWTQGVFSREPPLRWRWSKNGAPVAGEERVGVFHDDWPFLCEDVEISRDSGAISAWRASDRSRDCVTWASLWPRGAAASRAQILSDFESAGFRPGIDALD